MTNFGSNSYTYDTNGNQTRRQIGTTTFNLTYDPENRLTTVSGAATASFVYDGDGNRVKATVGGMTTVYIGNYFEWSGSTSTMKKYYYAGSIRSAMRTGSSTDTSGVNYLLSDHLGSTSVVTDGAGTLTSKQLYKPFGETRYTSGALPTTYQYTGQSNESQIGLYYYVARFYDPALGRFVSADTVVLEPGNPIDWDRYAYSSNNPINYYDPDGHFPLLVTALIGAGIAATVDYGWQVIDNLQSGQSFDQALLSVDGAEIVGPQLLEESWG